MEKSSLTPVDLNLFKVFVAIYTHRNLTRASTQIAMTQPAVSRALTRLNYVFREQMFQRIEGEMRPTPAAQRIAPLIFEALTALEIAVTATREFDPEELPTTFRIGGNDYVSSVVLPELVANVIAKAPHSFISMIHCTYINISELLHNNEIDCAVISSRPEDERLSAKPLFRDDFVVISRADHLIVSKGMTLDSYLAAEHVLVSHAGKRDGWVDERLMEIGKQRRIIATVHLFAAVLPIIAEQNALCTLPRRLAMHFAKNHDLHISEVPLQHQARMFYLVWSQNQSANPAARWFRGQIELICKAIH